MDSTPTQSPLRATQIIAPPTTKGQPFPGSAEQQLYTATLHDLGHVDRVYLSLDLVRTVVDSLAPYFAYHGRRLFFREKKLRAIARKAHRYIHSSQWVNATPPVAQFTVQDQRQRSMIAAWGRTTNKEADYCEILAFLGEHTLAEANQRWNRTKVWRARDWARKACFTTTTSPRSEEGKEINIKEDRLTEDSSTSLREETSFPACARTREAQQKGCHHDTPPNNGGDGMAHGDPWTDAEKQALARGEWPEGRTYSAIMHMRKQLRAQGITVKIFVPRLSPEEIHFVVTRKRGDRLPGRHPVSACQHAALMRREGIDVPYVSALFSLADCQFILEHGEHFRELALELNRDPAVVWRKYIDLLDRIERGLPLVGKRPNGMPPPKRIEDIGKQAA